MTIISKKKESFDKNLNFQSLEYSRLAFQECGAIAIFLDYNVNVTRSLRCNRKRLYQIRYLSAKQ